MANQSVTISFQSVSSDDIELTVDLDDLKNEASSTRTSSFIFGDEAFFRVFTNPVSGVAITCYPSDGILTSYEEGSAEYEIDSEILEFNQPYIAQGGKVVDNVSSLAFPVYSDFVATALSVNNCGSVTLNPLDPSEAVASADGPGVYDASYVSHYWSFSIQMPTIPDEWPEGEPYPIVIVVVGELL